MADHFNDEEAEAVEFAEELAGLIFDSDLDACSIIELSLLEIGRLSIDQMGSARLGINHLQEHLQQIASQLWEEAHAPTFH